MGEPAGQAAGVSRPRRRGEEVTRMGVVELHSLADTVEIAPGVHMPRLGLGTYLADAGPVAEREV